MLVDDAPRPEVELLKQITEGVEQGETGHLAWHMPPPDILPLPSEVAYRNPNIGDAVAYIRSHLCPQRRQEFNEELKAAFSQALETGDYTSPGDTLSRWWLRVGP